LPTKEIIVYLLKLSSLVFQQAGSLSETAKHQSATGSGAWFHASNNLMLGIKTRFKNSVSKGEAVDGKRETN
jgi:hypothetical protein